jgi:hypothetical protein
VREREGEKGRERVSVKEEIERSRKRRESVRGILCENGERGGGEKEQEIDRYKGRQ